MTPPLSQIIATHLVVPAWWVRAYEVSVMGEVASTSAYEQAFRAGLCPALSPLEMAALALVIGAMQEQILKGSYQKLRLKTATHAKEIGSGAKNRRYQFDRLVQILTSIQILRPGSPERGRLERIMSGYRIFIDDLWQSPGESTDDLELCLTLGDYGLELLLGITDAHSDLLTLLRGKVPTHNVLGNQAPLLFSKSLWLELSGPESLMYLRLERAIQWEFRWLQLNGTFGLPLSELFKGLSRDRSQQFKFLERLGRRLDGHGFLADYASDQYLAFSSEDRAEPLLVWQIARDRLMSEARQLYRTAGQKSLLEARFQPEDTDVSPLIRVFAGRSMTAEDLASAQADWSQLFSMLQGEGRENPVHFSIPALAHSESQSIAPSLLFFEYLLRSRSPVESVEGLPEFLRFSPIGPLLDRHHPDLLSKRFGTFCHILQESPDLVQELLTTPRGTLTSPASLKEESLVTALSHGVLAPSALVLETAVPLTTDQDMMEPSHRLGPTMGKNAGSPVASTTPFPRHLAARTSNPLDREAVPSLLTSPSTRMLKVASEELQKIKKNHPERYAQLKKAYLDSLDEAGRRTILDVQRHMQVHLFEEHLRQRLVRFMVDHPGAWQSAAAAKAKAP